MADIQLDIKKVLGYLLYMITQDSLYGRAFNGYLKFFLRKKYIKTDHIAPNPSDL
jgi:hypothetical protein